MDKPRAHGAGLLTVVAQTNTAGSITGQGGEPNV